MNRFYIERIATSLSVISLIMVVLTSSIALVDLLFNLNILSTFWEKFAYFVIFIFVIIAITSLLASIMLNVSIIAINSERNEVESANQVKENE